MDIEEIVTVGGGDHVHLRATMAGNVAIRCSGSDWAVITPRQAVELVTELSRLAHQQLPPDRD